MATRQVLKGYVLGKEHASTAKEALTLYTINNARIQGVDKDRAASRRQARRPCGAVAGHHHGAADAIRDTKADDGGRRESGLPQRDLRRGRRV